MAQIRKQRILVFEIRITVWTDFMQKLIGDVVKNVIYSIGSHEEGKGRKTKIEFTERVLDPKTFAEIKQ